jgi:hypothetical protein
MGAIMPTIYEISQASGLSLRTLRKLEKLGALNVTKSSDPITDAARENLKKGNKLTALQQLHLLRNPAARDTLQQWDLEIDVILNRLGDVIGEAIPWTISNAIELAARREPAAIEKISGAILNLINLSDAFDKGRAQDHAFIAVRLLADVPAHSLESLAKRLQSCLWQCRRSALSDCWRLNDKGQTEYFRPMKKVLANFDL